MSHQDTIAIFDNFISINNSVNRFFPELITKCRPRWGPSSKSPESYIKIAWIVSLGSYCGVFPQTSILCLHSNFVPRDMNDPPHTPISKTFKSLFTHP